MISQTKSNNRKSVYDDRHGMSCMCVQCCPPDGWDYRAEAKKLLQDFERMRDMAEIKALSNVSLERPLSDTEYNRMMALKKSLFG